MIIAISGKARAGKDLLASIAAPHGFEKLAFADPLKERVRKDFGLTLAQTDGALKEEPTLLEQPWRLDDYKNGIKHYWTPRQVMIEYGQFFRQFDKDFWVKELLIKINPAKDYIITDCRFPNEVLALKNIGATLVRLERHPDRDYLVSDEVKHNDSETALDKFIEWDFHLESWANRTPEDLKAFFAVVLDQIRRKV